MRVVDVRGGCVRMERWKDGQMEGWKIVLFPDPPPKRKGGSGEYSTASHHGLVITMDSAKSEAFKVSCWASVNWKCAK